VEYRYSSTLSLTSAVDGFGGWSKPRPGRFTPGIIIIIIIIINVFSCHRPFLPGTSLEPAVIPTAQASSFTLQYFPYYV
jgi:hypothetical protein